MVNYRQPVNSLGQAANIGQGNLLERVSILETRKRILVADASEEFRRVFTGALEEESGLELAAETGDGQETVRLAKELSPDIVVMDFVLARMDGLEVLSELAALPGLDVTSSWSMNLELMPAGVNKGMAVSALAQRLGIGPARVMALGDYDNDVSMFSYAGVSVAMANASERARAAARYSTLSNDEDGVAHAIRRYALSGSPVGEMP
mgnify:CR=1 FL=1